ncbi:MAG: AmmeMemoRadiSam system protein A [Myxococcota bacterium]
MTLTTTRPRPDEAVPALRAVDEQHLMAVARQAVTAASRGEEPVSGGAPSALPMPAGVFVTLRDGEGRLRGCVGHVECRLGSLEEEVAECARAAATRDWRFHPVTPDEVAQLRLELSLLGRMEPVDDLGELDPRVYGITVTQGARRGVLLPGIDGIDTPQDQFHAVCRKAGITGGATRIFRFPVRKVMEPVA